MRPHKIENFIIALEEDEEEKIILKGSSFDSYVSDRNFDDQQMIETFDVQKFFNNETLWITKLLFSKAG